jgi:DNA-directed RNA polymerase specialized sigma24 family protein
MTAPAIEDLLRELAPQVLGGPARRYGRFEDCEDAVQEAAIAAASRAEQRYLQARASRVSLRRHAG